MKSESIAVLCILVLLLPSLALAGDNPAPLAPASELPGPLEDPLVVAGLGLPGDEEVRIVRTAEGVPHIYADSPYALGFGNGYVQAEDRLFQLHVLRLVSLGKAASELGPDMLPEDLDVRRELYTHEERVEAYEQLPEFERELFDGYAAGVNRMIAEFATDPTRLPVEFPAVAALPRPWDVTDTIAIAQYLLDQFGSAGGAALSNAQLLAQLRDTLGEEEALEAFDDVVWLEHPLATTSIPASEGVYNYPEFTVGWDEIPADQREVALAAADAQPFGTGESLLPQLPPFKLGSNAVIVAPERSKSGGSLLGGGPQMGYFSPMVPYEVGLHGAGFDVAGIGVGGAPGVVIGRTDTFSWTVTSGIADQVDVVGVRLVEGEPRKYHYDGEEHEMDCRMELHVVRAPPPTNEQQVLDHLENDVIKQEVCRSVHGPVFAINEEAGWAFARERSHRYEEVNSGVRWLSLGMEKDLDGFLSSLDDFAFTFNFHYVDEDHIAFIHTGYHPVRDERLDPRWPRPGTGDYEWVDMLKGIELPRTVDPDEGWIVNWNNQPQRGWAGGGDQRELFGSVHRVDLLRERMVAAFAASGDGKLDLETIAQVVQEAAERDPFARHTVPWAIGAAEDHADPLVLDMRDALRDWRATDYSWATQDDTHSPGQTIYERWRTHLQEMVFRDEMGDHVREMGWDPPTSDDPHGGDYAQHRNKDALLIDVLEGRTTHDWCDNVTAPGTQTCTELILDALQAAGADLAEEFETTNVDEWRMDARLIQFVTINAGPTYQIPLQNRASYNHLHDWGVAENRNAGSVLPPGTQSGYYNLERFLNMMAFDEFHPHANDQLDLYVEWDYKPLRFYEDQVETDAYGEYTVRAWVLPVG